MKRYKNVEVDYGPNTEYIESYAKNSDEDGEEGDVFYLPEVEGTMGVGEPIVEVEAVQGDVEEEISPE